MPQPTTPPRSPARIAPALGLLFAALVCTLPVSLFWDELSIPRARGDDFAFLAASRGGSEPLRHLLEPHNAHVVPAFRLLTAALARLSGSLAEAPTLFLVANMLALAGLMLATGHLVAWESRRMAAGLAATTCLGVTSLLFPAATWFSAGQTLWTALFTALGLVLLQFWRRHNKHYIFIASCFCSLIAPLFWGGGVVAGIASAAYLWATRDNTTRRAALWALLTSLAALALWAAFGFASWGKESAGPAVDLWERPLRALAHTAQAITEGLIFQNLGLDTTATPQQAVLLLCVIAAAWLWSRRSNPRLNTLEAPGLVLLFVPYFMAYLLRAGYDFASLRTLGWYHTLPHLGAVLFVAGWILNRSLASPGKPVSPTRAGLAALCVLAAFLFFLHQPRVQRLVISAAPPMTDITRRLVPILDLQRHRAVYYFSDESARQYRALKRLERIQSLTAAQHVARETLRRQLPPFEIPGWPKALTELDAFDLIPLPDSPGQPLGSALERQLRDLETPEPVRLLDADNPASPSYQRAAQAQQP